jgi:membrane-associated protein
MLHQIETFLNLSKYALVFVGCIVEGPIVMVTSGFFLRTGQFDLLPLYFSLVSGDFVADIGWYAVGRFGVRSTLNKIISFFKITPEILIKIEGRFKKHQDKILIISKLTMGFGFALATLIVAGMLRVSFKRYVYLNLIGGFIWTGFLVAIGFFLGNVYATLNSTLKIIFIIIVACVIMYGIRFINNYLKKKEI